MFVGKKKYEAALDAINKATEINKRLITFADGRHDILKGKSSNIILNKYIKISQKNRN
jgi:alpha-beta hydrolase superfamily lysophospholipase